MANLLRIPRSVIGVLTLTAAAPVVAVEWTDLVAERDALSDEVARLRSAAPATAPIEAAPPDVAVAGYAGVSLPLGSAEELAHAWEDQTQLATEAAALRRELAATRARLDAWDRREGNLDLDVQDAPETGSAAESQATVLLARSDALRRRLQRADRDLDEVQLERDEALAELRREMFTNLVYSIIIGECGHRTGKRAFDACATDVRAALTPHWKRFEACVRDFNAVPAYTDLTRAADVNYAVRLDRGAVLMCDPSLPEGGL